MSAFQSRRSNYMGADGRLGDMTNAVLTEVEAIDPVTKIHYEQTYDTQGRLLLYRNLDTGDELRYTYDDTAKTMTIQSSGNYLKQVYKFDDAHPGDFAFARLIEEERDGIILAFRRVSALAASIIVRPHGLNPDGDYEFSFEDYGLTVVKSGRELADGLSIKIPEAPGSLLIRYRRVR